MCNINVKYFPFDEQTCKLVFASWSQDVSVLDLRERRGLPEGKAVAKKERGSDVFQENEEWTVEWISIERAEVRLFLVTMVTSQCHGILPVDVSFLKGVLCFLVQSCSDIKNEGLLQREKFQSLLLVTIISCTLFKIFFSKILCLADI